MEVEKLKEAKREMEVSIGDYVQNAIDEFGVKTGYTPKLIKIDLVDITEVGGIIPVYRVTDVDSTIPIF